MFMLMLLLMADVDVDFGVMSLLMLMLMLVCCLLTILLQSYNKATNPGQLKMLILMLMLS